MSAAKTYLVFGATGQTGRHFTRLALDDGHRVRVLARNPSAIAEASPRLEVHQGSITDVPDLDSLVEGVDVVVSLLGDARLQRTQKINTAFVERLVPSMRRHGVRQLLYQAGAMSAAPGRRLSPPLAAIRSTLARGYIGQHHDNEAVMRYLVDQATDIDWVVHRAAIGSDGPSKGVLRRSTGRPSIATFADCAAYGYRVLDDPTAVRTCDVSAYARGGD